jgi:hypothetical protein
VQVYGDRKLMQAFRKQSSELLFFRVFGLPALNTRNEKASS